jgi:hypothetical protein
MDNQIFMSVVENCAEAAYEANRIFCESCGDYSFGSWKDAPQWQKTTNIKGVEVALGGATPEQQHQAWVDHKVKDGWVYGEVKDPEQKTHPCLVPYPDLPAFQKAKDDLYIAVANAMYKALTT